MMGIFSAKIGAINIYWGILGFLPLPLGLQDLTGTVECAQIAVVVRTKNPNRDLTGRFYCIKEIKDKSDPSDVIS